MTIRVDESTRNEIDVLTMATVLAAPTSTSAQDASYRPEIELNGKMTKVLVEQMQSADPEKRFGRRVGRISTAERLEVDKALRLILALFRTAVNALRAPRRPIPIILNTARHTPRAWNRAVTTSDQR